MAQALDHPPPPVSSGWGGMNRDPGSPKASGGSASESLLAFVSSKEGALALLSMSLLIFQGTALSLTLRFSRLLPWLGSPRPNQNRQAQHACINACMHVGAWQRPVAAALHASSSPHTCPYSAKAGLGGEVC